MLSGLLLKDIAHLVVSASPRDAGGIEILRDVSVRTLGERIVQVGPGLKPSQGERVIDCSQCVVYPGFVNTHHHLYQTFQRCIPLVQDAPLFNWLVNLYEVWRELTSEAVYVSALVGIAELLLSGCTTTADHFYVFPSGTTTKLLDRTIEAAVKLGVRFHPTRGAMSLGKSAGGLPPDSVVQNETEIIKDCQRVIETYHDPSPYSMLRLSLAPCSPFSVTSDLMKETAAMARSYPGVRLHTHLAETLDEEKFCIEKFGMRPLGYAESLGWLGNDVWFAHGIHLNDKELELIAETQTGIAHCPASNMRLGSGFARVPEMLKKNIPVGLAVDGSASNDSSNMALEIRTALLSNRAAWGVDSFTIDDALFLATRGGAALLGRDDIATIKPNKAADFAVFDLNDIGLAGALHDPIAAPFLAFSTGRTKYTIVNGQVVVDQGQLVGEDTDDLILRANQLAEYMLFTASRRTGIQFMNRVKKKMGEL